MDWASCNTKYTEFGKIFENSVCKFLKLKYLNFYNDKLLKTHSKYPWLGATPDGIIKLISCETCRGISKSLEDIIYRMRSCVDNYYDLEDIYSLYSDIMKHLCYDERIVIECKYIGQYQWKRNFTDKGDLIKTGEFYYQIQYNMFIMKSLTAILIYKRDQDVDIKCLQVDYDNRFIENTILQLQEYYITKRIPYLIYKVNRKYKQTRFKTNKNNRNIMNEPIQLNKKLKKKKRKSLHVCNKDDTNIIKDYILNQYKEIFVNDKILENKQSYTRYVNKSHEIIDNKIKRFNLLLRKQECNHKENSMTFIDNINQIQLSKCKFQLNLKWYYATKSKRKITSRTLMRRARLNE